ncbi:low molecular weight phosphotyrosine protein phosphatase [Kitasatospora sp. NPDC018058]|uniref:arsenate reductase/protein-tyrosine-phosphatase family protein n=1 Tax=Kitasatospora sp. NPDC018058 TaxID=3364025 RepID=UPI0037BECD86
MSDDQFRHPKRHRILVVCLGNHNRSPIAAAVLAHIGGQKVEVRSAGLRERHVGGPAHSNAIRAAEEAGYDIRDHRAVKVNRRMLGWADVVLAMDHAVLAELLAMTDGTPDEPKLGLYISGEDVFDPWESDYTAYQSCVATIQAGAVRHLLDLDA